ncbi:hypothetical protein CBS101457_005778 [Exobasidium rhododendri]|nr:hypothetical protein CBS101457_005778 [Exobasidium rhododendri]
MAATAQSSFLTSAAVFAGGLAVGLGGAVALSRSTFAPSTKVNKSTKDKARNQISLPSSKASSKEDVPDAPPASEQLDAVDAKGIGHASKKNPANKAITPLVRPSKKTEYVGVTGKEFVPEPSIANRIGDLETKLDLTRPVAAHGDKVANDASQNESHAPVWLTGLVESAQLSTSTGVIDKTAYQSSTAIFVYESAANGGFGAWSEKEALDAESKGWYSGRPRVFSMQTRAGAGAAIAGYVAQKGTSSFGTALSSTRKVVTALTNADGFLAMAPSIAYIDPQKDSRLVLQVSSATQEGDEISNNYASILSAASTLSETNEEFAVILSADRVEAADVAAACYAPGVTGNVAHVFDGAYAGREIAKLSAPTAVKAEDAKQGPTRSVVDALHAAGYTNFVYEGPTSPTSLVVVPNGSHFSSARAVFAKANEYTQHKFGLLSVRVVRPWTNAEFVKMVPESVECIHVLDEARSAGTSAVLFDDVQSAIGSSGPTVQPISLQAGEALSVDQWFSLFIDVATWVSTKGPLDMESIKSATYTVPRLTDNASIRLASFFDLDSSFTSQTANLAARAFRERNTDLQNSRILSRFDNFESNGLVRNDLLLSSPAASDAASRIPLFLAAQAGETQTLLIGDAPSALKGYDVFASLAPGGTVIINSPGWDGLELAAKLKAVDKHTLAEKNARVYLIDATAVVESIHDSNAKVKGGKDKVGAQVPRETAAVVLLVALLRMHLNASPAAVKSILNKMLGTAPLGVDGVAGVVDAADRGIHLVAYGNEEWKNSVAASEAETNAADRPSHFRYNGFTPSADAASVGLELVPVRSTWALPAWETMFSEAYNLEKSSLRPDLDEENWVLTVTENRRLTPVDYDRNVFHMELSTVGTGLKYEVGEALGIHGWNDIDEVREFIKWSGYNPDEIISVPSLGSTTRFESRTVYQILQQRLDIFGKPPKRFYEVLSKLAINKDEAKWLRFISSPEGSSTFRKLAEVETVNYANVLQMFPSARMPLDMLMSEVEPIKPRHYSIASAQSFVGESVHLLIVTVDWKTPSGSPRYGQCTRYLANLKVGEQVTVSLKPSVMKLPPFTTQPIVMSGLGTGAAPFRAYLQARAVQKRNGEKIGPLIYIFGSRYKHAEYLYGEELEAYERDGIVKVLTAFSRDQKSKIYIQHRIEQNQSEILDLLMPSEGSGEEVQGLFTLCGPTDPLPDVQEALIGGFIAKTGKSHKEGEEWLESLKENERAVYEVY